MPQIAQLPYIFFSQLFWLLLVFGIIFFGVGRGMLPRVQSTVDAREKKIAEDLERAQAARASAEETEAAWRSRMDEARAEAARLAQEARQEGSRHTETQVKAAAEKINLKIESSEQKIREAVAAARGAVEAVASEATRDMVQLLAGIDLEAKDASAAVKAELNV